MNKNYMIAAVVIVIILGGIFIISNSQTSTKLETNNLSEIAGSQPQGEVKEFTMDSFYEMVDNKPRPQYSLKEITVNKGDTVRIIVTVTKGAHDFNIDEYNIRAETPLSQPTTIEFRADKTGEFIYYCSKPGHRENGHWGTLKVI